MTARDLALLCFIDEYWQRYWTSPSYREIGDFLGLASSSSVHNVLKRLVREGLLEQQESPRGDRSVLYRLTPQAKILT